VGKKCFSEGGKKWKEKGPRDNVSKHRAKIFKHHGGRKTLIAKKKGGAPKKREKRNAKEKKAAKKLKDL